MCCVYCICQCLNDCEIFDGIYCLVPCVNINSSAYCRTLLDIESYFTLFKAIIFPRPFKRMCAHTVYLMTIYPLALKLAEVFYFLKLQMSVVCN